jgi:hypothetical protein
MQSVEEALVAQVERLVAALHERRDSLLIWLRQHKLQKVRRHACELLNDASNNAS